MQRDWRAGPPVYSDINFILLGIVLERLAGARIRDLDPRSRALHGPPPEAAAAATEYCHLARSRFLVGEVHDENCSALQGAGHAGLFGTAPMRCSALPTTAFLATRPAIRSPVG
jgi:CubicO group peptidase (beta-lactamase class C family)